MLNENLEFSFSEMPIVFEQDELVGPLKSIHEKALARAKKYLVSESDLLESIIEVDKNRIYEKFKLTHLTPYCVQILGLSEEVAATFVRVARKSQQVPELQAAVNEGKLSVTVAKVIASVVTKENQKDWIEKASTFSKSKLEKEIARVSPKAARPEKAEVQGPDRFRVEFELTEEEMQYFRRAQEILSQKTGKFVSLAETQSELLKCYLEKHDPIRKAQRAKARREKSDRSQERSQARFVAKSESQNESARSSMKVAKVNRRPEERTKTSQPRDKLKAELVHAINLRDQGKCQARLPDGTICGESKWIQFHHIVEKRKGGQDTLENMITICGAHHRLWHRITDCS